MSKLALVNLFVELGKLGASVMQSRSPAAEVRKLRSSYEAKHRVADRVKRAKRRKFG